jgi:hypothetical protein
LAYLFGLTNMQLIEQIVWKESYILKSPVWGGDNRKYNALFVCYSNQLLHCHLHNKKSNIKKLYHVVFRFFFEHAIFSSFPSLFFHCHFLDSYLFLFRHSDFPQTYFPKPLHSYIFQLFHYSHLPFAKDCSIGSFHKTMSKDNVENDYFSINYAKNLIKF